MKFFNTGYFVTEKYSDKELYTLLKSTDTEDNIQGLRYILCKVQEGYDFSGDFDIIIKLIDTTNTKLKILTNEYFKYYFRNNIDEERKLLLVNTFLKDFGDMSDCIIGYIVELSNTTLIHTYMPYLIKYIQKCSNYKQLCHIAYTCDKKYGTELSIKVPTKWEDSDYLTLISLTDLTMPDNIIDYNIYNTPNLIPIVRKIFYNGSDLDSDVIKILLKKNNITLFYYIFKIIVSKYPELLQDAYNQSLIHMSTSYEYLYHLLILHEDIIDRVKYTNRTYSIFFSDPDYIKIQKIKILFKNIDEISIKEIRRHKFLEIINLSIKYNCTLFEDVFYENEIDDTIRALYIACKERRLAYVIQKYLISILNRRVEMKENILRMFVYLCSIYFDSDILPEITANFNTILSYYINLYKRGILKQPELVASLQKYSKQHKDKLKIILELIKSDINSITQFTDKISITEEPKIKIDLYNNLLDCKPYSQNNTDIFENKKVSSLTTDLETNIKKVSIKNNEILHNYILYRDTKKENNVFIDHKSIKGVVYILNNILLLNIDILEQDINIKCIVDKQTTNILLSKESKVELCDVSSVSFVKLYLCNEVYNISIKSKISKNIVSKEEWNKEFNKLNKYKLVENFMMMDEVHKVDEERFSFCVYDKKVYGRIYNNQIILKSSEDVLKEL